jgi:hypothetical protein
MVRLFDLIALCDGGNGVGYPDNGPAAEAAAP